MGRSAEAQGQPVDMNRIRSGIYLGSQAAEEGPVASLKSHCITHILQLGTGPNMQPTHANGALLLSSVCPSRSQVLFNRCSDILAVAWKPVTKRIARILVIQCHAVLLAKFYAQYIQLLNQKAYEDSNSTCVQIDTTEESEQYM